MTDKLRQGCRETVHALEQGKLEASGPDRARLVELYRGEIAFADAQIGRLLALLDRRGLGDDTAIVVAADHGESFGEHGKWAHGTSVFHADVHVPLLLRYPARIPTGRVVDAPVQLVDVLPTLAELAGLGLAQAVQGTSLLPFLSGNPPDERGRCAFTELADEAFVSLVASDASSGEAANAASGIATWQLIRNNANGELQLYNLRADPSELRDLARIEPRTVKELGSRLADLMKLSGVSR